MKKIYLLAACLWMTAETSVPNAASVNRPLNHANNESWMQMKAADFVKLTVKEFATLSQKKLTLKEKIAFSVLKRNLKRELKKNPDLTVNEYLAATANKKISAWAWVAIVLSVLLIIFLIGVATYD